MPDITIGRLRGGYSVSWYVDGKRRRYKLEARTRKKAEAEGRDVFLSKSVSTSVDTVSEAWEAYRTWLEPRPTAETMKYTGKPIKEHFGALRPDQISENDSLKYTKKRQEEGIEIGAIHTELGHLRSAMNWGVRKDLFPKAPEIKLPPKPDSDVRPLSDEEVQSIVNNCIAPHARLAVILLLSTGARVSAILDRTWDKIDFDRGVIDLRQSDAVTRKGRAVVPMNALARTALQTAYEGRQTEWVVEYNGKPIKSIRKAYSSALARAGLSGIRIHQLRHTVAVRLLAAGEPIEVVSQYLGHSNIQITLKTYARFQPEHMVSAASALNFGLAKPNRA